jgi:hypothetical protein
MGLTDSSAGSWRSSIQAGRIGAVVSSTIVDLDDLSTWPASFRRHVGQAERSAEPEPFFGISDDLAAIATLQGARLRAYHCTRLTPREVQSVHTDGLRPLSPEFTFERIADAVTDGHLTEEEGEFYGRTDRPRASNRAGLVWLCASKETLADGHAIGNLVEAWGGEGINMAINSRSPEFKRLERVGRPTVVIAAIDPTVHYARGGPGILSGAVRRLREDVGGTSIECHVAIGPEFIEAVEHPGGAFWSNHVWTPRRGFVLP